MNCKNKSFMTKKKAFTLIELLIVIAIIGILFIVLVSKVDFATDKAKATGVQTDFRSFQMAFDTVAKENAGFNTFGWDTGDANQNGKRDSYDEGDNGAGGGTAQNGIQDGTEVFTGHKVYAETFSKVYSLKKNGTGSYDRDALNRLEAAINANLDPKLHITIKDDGEIVMANGAQDPWNKEYHGYYISNAEVDGKDRGAIVMYSDGANNEFGSEHSIENGIVKVIVPGSNKDGKDDYSIVSLYTYVNGYGEVKNVTTGFSNNQTMLAGNNGGVVVTPNVPETPDEPIQPDDPNLPVNGVYEMLNGANQTFDAETPADLSFRSKADFNKFAGVKVDGVSVASTNYTVSEGSTIVTLKADYLTTLGAGEHYVEIVSNDGVATTEFDVVKEVIPETYTISGVYKFNNELTYLASGQELETYVNYNIINYNVMGCIVERDRIVIHDGYVGIYGTGLLATLEGGNILDFGVEQQEVSKDFYVWLMNNATKVADELVYFMIDNNYCVAEKGMTFGEWTESEYHSGNSTINLDDYLWFEYITYIYTDQTYKTMCHKDDVIVATTYYGDYSGY